MKYFDLHCDTATECFTQNQRLYKNPLQLSIEQGIYFEKWIQVFAIWMNDELRGEASYDHFCKVYDYFLKELDNNQQYIKLCTTKRDIKVALEQRKKVAILSIEGSAALGGKLERVQEFYDKGVRFMTLTWNGACEVADGCMLEETGGLTNFGKDVITKMNGLKMIVDVSHLAEKGFWDLVNYTNTPFIATHSNSKTICNHPRNLSDKAFTEIVNRGGLVGLNFYPVFINGKSEANMEELLPHIDHFLKLGGEDTLALGSDFDGATMPLDLRGIQDVTKLYDKLVKKYGTAKSDKICYENAVRFVEKWMD